MGIQDLLATTSRLINLLSHHVRRKKNFTDRALLYCKDCIDSFLWSSRHSADWRVFITQYSITTISGHACRQADKLKFASLVDKLLRKTTWSRANSLFPVHAALCAFHHQKMHLGQLRNIRELSRSRRCKLIISLSEAVANILKEQQQRSEWTRLIDADFVEEQRHVECDDGGVCSGYEEYQI